MLTSVLLAAVLAPALPARSAVLEPGVLPLASAPAPLSLPAAVDLHLQVLTGLAAQPAWIAPAAAYLQASIAAAPSAPAQAAAARLVVEAIARPELFPSLPESPALEARVQEAHGRPESRQALLQAIAPLRAQDDDRLPAAQRLDAWRAAFDGSPAAPYAPFVRNFPGMLYAYGDPAAIRAGKTYYVASTSNNAPDAGPIVKS